MIIFKKGEIQDSERDFGERIKPDDVNGGSGFFEWFSTFEQTIR